MTTDGNLQRKTPLIKVLLRTLSLPLPLAVESQGRFSMSPWSYSRPKVLQSPELFFACFQGQGGNPPFGSSEQLPRGAVEPSSISADVSFPGEPNVVNGNKKVIVASTYTTGPPGKDGQRAGPILHRTEGLLGRVVVAWTVRPAGVGMT